MKQLFLFLIVFLLHGILSAQTTAGLDPTFGTNGIVKTMPDQFGGNAISLALQSDGKIVAGGSPNALAIRYLPDGTVDNSFAASGIFTTSRLRYPATLQVLIQGNGKILLIGSGGISDSFFVTRLNTDGSFDSSFGDNGITVGFLGGVRCAGLQPDGKVLVAGDIYDHRTAVVRLKANGIIDSTFGTNGYVNTSGTPPWWGGIGQFEVIDDMDVMPDGKFVLAGDGRDTFMNSSIVAIRYLPNGALDTTFNHVGFKHVYLPGLTYGRTVKVQQNGKVLIGGSAGNSGTIIRLNENGTIDASFGLSGSLEVPNVDIRSLIILPTGKIACGGDHGDWIALRAKADGSSLDSGFGRNGIIANDINNTTDERINQIIVQPDNKIVACGYTAISSGVNYFTLTRYLPDATTAVSNIPSIGFGVNIYPNPTSNTIQLVIDHPNNRKGVAKIIALDGRVLLEKTVTNGGNILSLTTLPSGTYFISVTIGTVTKTQSITKT